MGAFGNVGHVLIDLSCRYITMLNFCPRTRPQRPIVLSGSVFACIKLVPEEWSQVVSTMLVRPKFDMKPVNCHVSVR